MPRRSFVAVTLLLAWLPAFAGDTLLVVNSEDSQAGGRAADGDVDAEPDVSEDRRLSADFLLGTAAMPNPVSMPEYAPRPGAGEPGSAVSGVLRLLGVANGGDFAIVLDEWDRVAEVGEAVRHLPEFDFAFVQRGRDIVPLEQGVRRRSHAYWEIIVQPGTAWQEPGDGDWSRAAVPFALQERAANCTHNGILTWLYRADGAVSRVAYQVSAETCGYFKFDMWGVLDAEFERLDAGGDAQALVARLDAHRAGRLPVRPLQQLEADHPGVDAAGLGVDDGIDPADTTVLGMVVDGVHYRSDCATRHGAYPFCADLPLPSYSTAKSVFAAIATMRLEKLYPGTSQRPIATLVDECPPERWGDVSIENALDMATGNFASSAFEEDEYGEPHTRFVFADRHGAKLEFACRFFRRSAEPGTQFVYHTSDTYLVGVALQSALAEQGGTAADLYASVVRPLWRKLGLSPLLDTTKRTYDDVAQPFAGYGLTFEIDDILRIAAWLGQDQARLDGESALDEDMLAAALFRSEGDLGLQAGSRRLRYNNGFWGWDAGPELDCDQPVWVPFMSGVSGITVAMFPNGVIYYYFSDGYEFSWKSARIAAHAIRSLCQ